MRMTLLAVLLPLLAVAFAPLARAQDQQPNLFGPGELSEPGQPPAGWVGDPSDWMLGSFRVVEADGRYAIRIAESGRFISATTPVPEGVEAVTMTWDIRAGDYEPGPRPWDVPYLHIRALDGQGNKLAEKQNRVRDARNWTSQSVTLALPQDAKQIQVAFGHRLKSGVIEVANIRVTPATGEAKAQAVAAREAKPTKLSAGEVRQLAERVPAPDAALRGAKVDEAKASEVIRVAAEDSRLRQAFGEAKEALQAGKGVRLVLEPGVHRIDRPLEMKGLNDAGRQAVLVVESAGPGKAVIRGSRLVPPEQWEVVDAQLGIYRIEWTEQFGFQDAGYYTMRKTPLQRREMVMFDGEPLIPVDIETYTFTDSSGKVYNEVGLLVEEKPTGQKRSWSYEGFAGLGVLEPGTFAVADRDDADHPYANSLLIRLPAGRESLSGATIEIGEAAELMEFEGKDNLVLRNLAFEQAASWRNYEQNNSALRINGWGDDYSKHVLIEGTEFRNNRAQGPNINAIDHLTVRGMLVEMSGNRGGRFDFIRNAEFDGLVFRRNNWLGEAVDSIMHSTGGLGTMFVYNAEFRNSSFNDNYGFGFRSDAGWDHVDMIDCEFSNNRGEKNGGGVFHEITRGPINHIRSRIEGNAERGLFLHNADNVTVEDSIIRDNRQSGLSIYINDRTRSIALYIGDVEGTNSGWSRGGRFDEVPITTSDNTVLRNSIVSTTRGADSYLIERTPGVGSKEAYDDWAVQQYKGAGNTFWNPDARQVFTGPGGSWRDRAFVTFEQWQELTGEDQASRWAEPE